MADCPHCGSPFSGSHFGDCRVSENSPRRLVRSGALVTAQQVAQSRVDAASKRMHEANQELIAAEAEYGAASRDLDSFTNDGGAE